jgi:hypothetical protein
MTFELKTDFKGLNEYQTYPDIFEFNYMETCDIPEEFEDALPNAPTSAPTSVPTPTPSSAPTPPSPPSPPLNPYMKRGSDNESNVAGIVLGILVSIGFIFYSLYLFNDEARDEYSNGKYIVLFLTIIIMFLIAVIFGMTYKRIDNAQNAFNCNVTDSNIPFNTVNDLGLDPSILKKLNINNTGSLCQDIYNLNKGYRVSPIPSNLCTMNYTTYQNYIGIMKAFISIPIMIVLIISYGTFFPDDFFDFITRPGIKIILISLLMLAMIGLICALYTNITSNKLAFQCNDLGSVRNRLNAVAMTDNRIMTPEEYVLITNLNKLNLDDTALICNDNQRELKSFEPSSNSFDGLLLFVYIIVSIMLIFFTILIVTQNDLESSIFNLSYDIGPKIGYLFLTLSVCILTFVSVIYPATVENNPEKASVITGTTSTIIPITIIIFSAIVGTSIGEY